MITLSDPHWSMCLPVTKAGAMVSFLHLLSVSRRIECLATDSFSGAPRVGLCTRRPAAALLQRESRPACSLCTLRRRRTGECALMTDAKALTEGALSCTHSRGDAKGTGLVAEVLQADVWSGRVYVFHGVCIWIAAVVFRYKHASGCSGESAAYVACTVFRSGRSIAMFLTELRLRGVTLNSTEVFQCRPVQSGKVRVAWENI